jgi:class 3 adenylate cyclase
MLKHFQIQMDFHIFSTGPKKTFFMLRQIILAIYGIFILSISISFARNPQIDSLKSVLISLDEDTVKVNTLNVLSGELYGVEPEEAIRYGNEAKELAKSLDFHSGLALALKNTGMGFYFQGNYVEASINWEESLKIYESIGDEWGAANLMSNLGAVYSMQGDDAKAVDYLLRSLKISERSGDSLRIATCLMNIGTIYSYNPTALDKAIDHYKRAIIISESINNLPAIGTSALGLGDSYYQLKEYDTALIYLKKSLAAFEDPFDSAATLNSMGKVYAAIEDYETAIKFQKQAFEAARKTDAILEMTLSLIGLANTYKMMGDFKMAIRYFKEGQQYAQEIGSNHDVKDAYEGLALSYAELSDYRSAYLFQKLYSQIKDTIYNVETDDKIKSLQFTYQLDKKEGEIAILEKNSEIEQLKIKRQRIVSLASGSIGILLLVLALMQYRRIIFTRRTKEIIEKEKDRSDELLLNILPSETAEELKIHGEAKARHYESVSILFTDFKGFTRIAARMTPEILVKEIDTCYKKFDEIITKYKIEKIKTIGDAYMAAGGLPVPTKSHAIDVVKAALEIRDFMDDLKNERIQNNQPYFELRLGIHTGPVVAGIVGTKKFAYDIWGDTVNIASRMESNSEAGKINISGTTYELVKGYTICEFRGEIEVKNRGKLKMYFIKDKISIKSDLTHEVTM